MPDAVRGVLRDAGNFGSGGGPSVREAECAAECVLAVDSAARLVDELRVRDERDRRAGAVVGQSFSQANEHRKK